MCGLPRDRGRDRGRGGNTNTLDDQSVLHRTAGDVVGRDRASRQGGVGKGRSGKTTGPKNRARSPIWLTMMMLRAVHSHADATKAFALCERRTATSRAMHGVSQPRFGRRRVLTLSEASVPVTGARSATATRAKRVTFWPGRTPDGRVRFGAISTCTHERRTGRFVARARPRWKA